MLTHFCTPQILTTSRQAAAMYRALANIRDGAASLEYSL